ncbi:GNAT family N-acetyltransferase [Flavobacterium sp.]|uniref:GNAT family N-acetyltransferase n=1 Tax=Flavobacterium sp. TaxID=239 RepID=UPI002C658103|nr:GNAT family N-acetyltransferase [Flavobacterium sp.]HSD06825.1 GNAT family N-acetyltransferase [Flavobacterium sp.]
MTIETLNNSDVSLLNELQPFGWGDILPAHEFYTTNTDFCFSIRINNDTKIVGIGTAIIHNDVAWLGHIIVHAESRNQGIGRLITQSLVKDSVPKNCETIYLIATDLGSPVYTKVGFETETEYLFFKDIKAEESWKISNSIIPFLPQHKAEIAEMDQLISGENRLFHLEKHLKNGFVYQNNNSIEGFYLPTFGEGLILTKTKEAGIEFMKMRFTNHDNACFPKDNIDAIDFLYKYGDKEFKRAKRMILGKRRSWNPSNLYNRIGGNIG